MEFSVDRFFVSLRIISLPPGKRYFTDAIELKIGRGETVVCGRERDVSMFDGFEIGATLEVEEVKSMNDEDSRLFVTVLKEIRDNQKLQLDRQAEAIALQREQFALVQRQAERHERIQDRAENIQARSAQVMAVARKTLFFVLPIVTLLIVYVSWLILRLLIR